VTIARLNRTQILLKPDQRKKLTQIARLEKRSLSDVVRGMIDAQLVARKRQEMAAAAQALLPDYQSDKELTAFTVLDSEDVE
jgi:predicted CopG family antitoxin